MLSFSEFSAVISEDAANAGIRRIQRLDPTFGKGQKIYPPTYSKKDENSPPRHCFERRKINGQEFWCCLLDSVASQANRFEVSLLKAERRGLIKLPYQEVDFTGTGVDEPKSVTSLESSHRIFDVHLRDSLLDGVPFMKSEIGQRIAKSRSEDATALLEFCPHALIFGAWHTQDLRLGGLGTKFPRCVTSEINAIDVPIDVLEARPGTVPDVQTAARRPAGKRDVLNIRKEGNVIYKSPTGWGFTESEAGAGAIKCDPSDINHGSIPPDLQPLGITMDYGEQRTGISFPHIRQNQFGSDGRNSAAHTYLLALALVAIHQQTVLGYGLRSGCDLVPDGSLAPFELMRQDGKSEPFELDRVTILKFYATALSELAKVNFQMHLGPLRLFPSADLIQLMKNGSEPRAPKSKGSSAPEQASRGRGKRSRGD